MSDQLCEHVSPLSLEQLESLALALLNFTSLADLKDCLSFQ